MSEPLLLFNPSDEGYDAAAEVEGESVDVANNLGRVGILDGFHRLEPFAERAYLRARIVEQLAECLNL